MAIISFPPLNVNKHMIFIMFPTAKLYTSVGLALLKKERVCRFYF